MTQNPPTAPDIDPVTGLSALQSIIDGTTPGATIGRVLNFRLTSVAEGRAVFQGTPTGDHLNPMGTVHGGWYGAVLDSALGCAVATTLPAGQAYTTLEYKVNLTRGARPGTLLECVGLVQHRGRSTATATAELRGVEDGKLYASGSTTCIILQT